MKRLSISLTNERYEAEQESYVECIVYNAEGGIIATGEGDTEKGALVSAVSRLAATGEVES